MSLNYAVQALLASLPVINTTLRGDTLSSLVEPLCLILILEPRALKKLNQKKIASDEI